MQAALVTGGMLAAGTGVASASENCPERPTSPFGGPLTPAEAAGDGTPSRSGVCFAGELFPDTEETLVLPALDGDGERVSRLSEADTLVGSIAPIREAPAEADNERTLRIPRITDELAPDLPREEQWIPPQELPDPTGHSVFSAGRGEAWGSAPESSTVSSTVPQDRVSAWTAPAERPRARHAAAAEEARPADGPHRSVSWSGALTHEAGPVAEHSGAESAETARHALVLPDEGASALASSPAEGIISMWRGSGGMLDTAAVDLTTVGFETGPDLRAVPERVLRSAVSTGAGQRRAVSEEKAPLDLPGEVHQRVDELPTLPDPALLFPGEEADGAEGLPDTGISLSGEDEANTLGGNTDGAGSVALAPVRDSGGAEMTRTSEEVLFTPVPELSEVSTRVVDELAAAVPERQVVTSNPFRETTTARRGAPEGGVALPILDRAPQVDALEGMTVPLPAVGADGTPRAGAASAAA
ncbi:hypothetical protein CEP50_10200 [Actinopolyspora mortivallis]|uniref:Uncharacterized protein n=1 Tax=Actinopolyspora mortivallis TaxID=33906 RepID=A0A2T0GWF3_ACTMO|nr:hypothetical protein CEP50_10200 [Actinopolyspora mortivallis]